MTTIRTRLATTIGAAGLTAGSLLGLGATAAVAAPVAPAPAAPAADAFVPPAPASAGSQQAPAFWASKVNLTFVNNTDLTLYYQLNYQSPKHTIVPGQSFYLPGNDHNSNSLMASTADKKVALQVLAYNHEIGTPSASSWIQVGGQKAEGKEHQGTEEHDRITSLGGLEVSSYRHADRDGKNFTMTLTKSGSAAVTVDNTASSRNTFIYTNGVMTPIKKGETGTATALERGKAADVQVANGGTTTDLRVSWNSHQATFTGFGKAASLANGESATFGPVTVTRADVDNGSATAFTYKVR
ncbi:MAG: hypothetical protein RLZ55_690 [Actinomycetota bacterium]|jgi:hypothetical protein